MCRYGWLRHAHELSAAAPPWPRCSRRSATPTWRRRAAICTRGRTPQTGSLLDEGIFRWTIYYSAASRSLSSSSAIAGGTIAYQPPLQILAFANADRHLSAVRWATECPPLGGLLVLVAALPVKIRQGCWMHTGVGEPSRHYHHDKKDQPSRTCHEVPPTHSLAARRLRYHHDVVKLTQHHLVVEVFLRCPPTSSPTTAPWPACVHRRCAHAFRATKSRARRSSKRKAPKSARS